MINIAEKALWILAGFVLVGVVGWFLYFGGPTTVPYILAQSESVKKEDALKTLSPEAKVSLEKTLNAEPVLGRGATDDDEKGDPKGAKARPAPRRQAAQVFMRANRATFERVSTKNQAMKEADKAKSEVVRNSDGTNSLRVYDFDDTSILSQVGVQENDIIDLVDGKKIDFTSPLEANQLYDECKAKFATGSPIVVEVTRRGARTQIVVLPNF